VSTLTRLGLAVCLLLPSGLAAQRPAPARERPASAQRAEAPAARRQLLQQEVVERFLQRVSNRLGLDEAQRRQLVQVVRMHDAQRRELTRQARQLRQDLVRAANDASTPPGELDRVLARMGELRQRDLQLWRAEQADLARVLTPRQRAQFMVLRLDFFEMVQRARQAPGAPLQPNAPGLP
jgi:Spy/CpxP family protein refolding chaperone